MERRFNAKVAVVTGAASGIGRVVAERLAREGAAVLLADRNAEGGEVVAAAIRDGGGDAAFAAADVRQEADCARMVATAQERWGGIDALVNSAGIGDLAPVAAMEEATWDRILDVNLTGTFLCCKHAFPALVARGGGSIVNLASVAGLMAAPGFGAYGTSKAGVVQLTRVLALEGAPHRVRANALCPVWIDTPMVQQYLAIGPDPAAARRGLEATIPMGRLGTAEEVAAAALFLLSDEASFITGVALPIDGGAYCRAG